MNKRYQVFVSSTFIDLQEERREVMQALLELRCIPAGMELFPASNDEQWKLIKRVIDDSDYYIVVVGGRYGSIGPDGISYTEMEYRYALEKGKPIIGFLHENPGAIASDKTETDANARARLGEFRKLVEKKMVKTWKNAHDLGSKVSRGIVNLIEDYPAVGWVKADLVPDEDASIELLRMRKQIEELQGQLEQSRIVAPEGTQALAQGDDTFQIHYKFKSRKPGEFSDTGWTASYYATWNEIFGWVGPLMIDEVSEHEFRGALDLLTADRNQKLLYENDSKVKGFHLHSFKIDDKDFQTIKIQLKALGLMGKSSKTRSVKNQGTYWALTPYGDTVLTNLRAISKRKKKVQLPKPPPGEKLH